MKIRKLLAAALVLVMVLAAVPVVSLADTINSALYETRQLKKLDNFWTAIDAAEAEAIASGKTREEVIKAVYEAALNLENVDTDSFSDFGKDGFFFSVDGMYCNYNYRLRNELVKPENVPEDEGIIFIPGTSKDAESKNVLLVGPYYSSDNSFTDQYKNESTSIAQATGGSCTQLVNANATGPNIAAAYTDKGVVIYDSHGVQSGTSSYLCLTTNTGITTTDYNNGWAVSSGSAAYIDGRYIQNHVSGTLANPFVWMAICEGMKKAGQGTTGTALLAAGAGGVYGYSQSVSFTGDYKYEGTFWTEMKNGAMVKDAIATMKSTWGNWDPAYSSSSGAAWPIVMSPVDSFPSNPDGTQTVNCTWKLFGESYTVTATTNNTNYGTVSVNGYVITASPKTGYYAAGYTVTSGTATVTQDGNTFTVNPSSDCTVRINFAAKPTYTVNFVAVGESQGSQSALVDDSITLPGTVSVNPVGWTFAGWIEQQIEDTTTKPTYYAPSASYTVTGNTTLYAIYTQVDTGATVTGYELVSSAPSSWAGNYVITYGTNSGMYLLKGVAGSSSGTQIENSNNCSSYANAGVTLNNNVLINVANDYVFTFAASGNYYSVKNVATNSYLGQASNYYLASYSTLNSTYCLWTPGYASNCSSLYSSNSSSSYPYLSFTTSSYYFWTGSANSSSYYTNVRLWKETQVTTSAITYSTNPTVDTHEHVMQHVAAVEPTCNTAGNIEYWYCAECGKYFSDAEGNNQITYEQTILPATGDHDYTVWTSNNNGTHSHYCEICGDTETANCTYVDVVTAPTTTSQGYTTHTCSVCGYSFVDSYVDPLATYTVVFSTPDGVPGTSSVTCIEGNTITLPTAGDVEGYSFIGWTTAELDETTNAPTFYAPAAQYAPTTNVTLYALYTRVEESGGETIYQQTDTLEVGGRYVITAGNYAVGNTIYNTSNNHYVTSQSVTINDSTNTLTTSVDINTILYEIESGSESAGYVFKNVGNGKYLTLGSDEYLIVGDTALAWLWTGSDLNNQVDSEGYYYLARSSDSKYFTTSKSTNGTIVLYKEVSGEVVYYTTNPVVQTPVVEYTVTFKDWDGTVLKTETVTEGGAATAPADPTRTGYTFTGWDKDFSNVTENLTVTAQYQINSYTVRFLDWNGTVLKTQTVNYGGYATAPANPEREGYTFAGWDKAYTNVQADLDVNATYTINTYTVRFLDWNGTVLKTQTVEHGAAATAPADPTREGYTFTGWDVAFNNITADLDVTAQYTEIEEPPVVGGNGDINDDGVVDVTDALLALRASMGSVTLTAEQIARGDVNGDGIVDSTDAILIMRSAMA